MSEYKVGDRIKVAFEATVHWVQGNTLAGQSPNMDVRLHDGSVIPLYHEAVDAGVIEKIDPPVETFKPGDVVRRKSAIDPNLRVIAHDGWVNLTDGTYYPFGSAATRFTSEDYERVHIS